MKNKSLFLSLFSQLTNTNVPYHQQLLTQIRTLILSARLTSGDKLPSESQLGTHLNISRNTVRQALASAENEGLIVRVTGKGSFVAEARARSSAPALIGYIVSNFVDNGHHEMIVESERILREAGFALVFASSHQNFHEEYDVIDRLVQIGVTGLVVWPALAPPGSTFYQNLVAAHSTSLVFIDHRPPGVAVGTLITSDHFQGGQIATRHLVDLGHQRIRYVSTTWEPIAPIHDRYKGYQRVCQESGRTAHPPLIIDVGMPELSVAELLRIIEGNPGVVTSVRTTIEREIREGTTAMLFVNDSLAVLAQHAVRDVRHSLVMVGFDGSPIVRTPTSPFPTVVQDFGAIGREAAHTVIDLAHGKRLSDPHPLSVRFSHEAVTKRGTTRSTSNG